MAREAEQGQIVHESWKPTVHQSSRKARAEAPKATAAPKPKADSPGLFENIALSGEELANFITALQDLSDMGDAGVWHLGLDTDPNVPDKQGNPGVPIMHMSPKEAQKVADLFMFLGKKRPEVYKAMRAFNQSHVYLQAGLILGSRFWELGMHLFKEGLNFRWSKADWTNTITKEIASHAAQS